MHKTIEHITQNSNGALDVQLASVQQLSNVRGFDAVLELVGMELGILTGDHVESVLGNIGWGTD